MNFDFLSILYSNPLREIRKPKLAIGVTIGIAKYDLPFKKRYEPKYTRLFLSVAISSWKPPTYLIKDEPDEIKHNKLYQKELT